MQQIKLKYLFNAFTGNSISDKSKYLKSDNANYYIATKDIDIETNKIDYSNGIYIPKNDTQFKIAKPKTILLCVEGANAGKKIAFTDKEVCFVNKLCAIKGTTEKVFDKYYFYYFQSYIFQKQFFANLTGIIGGLSISVFKNLKIPLPPLPQQKAIANYLDNKTAKIQKFIKNKTRLVELLKEQRQAVIDAVVSGKLLMVHGKLEKPRETKPSGIDWLGDIPKHWEVRRLKYVFDLYKGLSITKENLKDNGIYCVNYGEIHSKYGFELNPEIHQLKCVDEDYIVKYPSTLLKKGDFIFADTSEDLKGCGNFTYLNSDKKTVAGYHTIICKPKNNIQSRFLAYIFNSTVFRSQIQSKVRGVKVYSITQNILKDVFVWMPNYHLQLIIIHYLDTETSKIDQAIVKAEKEIALIKEYKEAMISEAVVGKLNING